MRACVRVCVGVGGGGVRVGVGGRACVSELRSSVKVEAAALGSPSLISIIIMVNSVDVKQH